MKNLFLTFIFILLFGLISCNNSFDDELKTITPVDTQVVVKSTKYCLHIIQNLNIDSIPYYYFSKTREWTGKYDNGDRIYTPFEKEKDTLYWLNSNFVIEYYVDVETTDDSINDIISTIKDSPVDNNIISMDQYSQLNVKVEYIPHSNEDSINNIHPDVKEHIIATIKNKLNHKWHSSEKIIWNEIVKRDHCINRYGIEPTLYQSYYYYSNSYNDRLYDILFTSKTKVKTDVEITPSKNNYFIDGYTSGGSYDLGSI